MKNQENDIEKIDRFLAGKMNADEKSAFEKQISEDESLREEVALHQDVKVGIGKYQEANLKIKLKKKEAELQQPGATGNRKSSGKIFWWTAMAAAISLLLVAFFWLFVDDSPQALYAQYYQPYPNVVSPLDRASPRQMEENPYQLYETGRYEEAIAAFEQQLEKDEDSDFVLRFYLGLSYLETQQTAAAIEQLKKASQAEHSLSSAASWYLGLAYLQAAEEDKAITVIGQLAREDNDFQQKAQELLEEF